MYSDFMPSPFGGLEVIAIERGIACIRFVDDKPEVTAPSDLTRLAMTQLSEYFAGVRRHFDLPLVPTGTPFQQRVWQALVTIPYGETCSYGYIAQRIGNPKGVRAVGLANGKNPIAIVVPCHRVIGANGKLTGYAGGLDRKAGLLRLEGA